MNLISVRRGSGSWASGAQKTANSIPYEVQGKCGSVVVKLMPAPQGTGLVVSKECQKLLALAGFKDVYSKTKGQTKTSLNAIVACFRALESLNKFKLSEDQLKQSKIVEGKII
jgi:small subunit ribosomal protein S5